MTLSKDSPFTSSTLNTEKPRVTSDHLMDISLENQHEKQNEKSNVARRAKLRVHTQLEFFLPSLLPQAVVAIVDSTRKFFHRIPS